MAETKINKIIYGGKVLMDLTGDTITPDKLKKGVTAHDKSGATITGTCTHDVDSGDATATADELLKGKTAYIKGKKVTGNMTNNGAKVLNVITHNGKITIPQGFHDGSGYAQIDPAEQAKLIAENVREGITLLGILGTMSGTEDAKPQAVEVIPGLEEKVIRPDAEQGYNYLSEVTVKPIPYKAVANDFGGTTVTIG